MQRGSGFLTIRDSGIIAGKLKIDLWLLVSQEICILVVFYAVIKFDEVIGHLRSADHEHFTIHVEFPEVECEINRDFLVV